MKNLKYIFITFLFIFLFPIKVHAAYPMISPGSYSLIESGFNELYYPTYANYDLLPVTKDQGKYAITSLLNTDISLTSNDFTIRPLNDIEIENLYNENFGNFYDSNGNTIPLQDLYYVVGSNSFLYTEFYMDSNGDIVCKDSDGSHFVVNYSLVNDFEPINDTYFDWDDIFYDLSQRIIDNNYAYYPDLNNVTDNTYFVWVGETAGGRPSKAGYILIQNQNIPGTIVPINDTGTIYRWYTNDTSLIQSVTTLGNFQPTTVSTGNYSYNGYTYRYLVTGIRGANSMGTPINYDDWIDGTDRSSRIFGRQGYMYSELQPSSDSIGFKKTTSPTIPLVAAGALYSSDVLSNLDFDSVPISNPDFDPTLPISEINYPVTYPVPSSVVDISTLPLPGSYPEISPLPGFSPDDLLQTDPTEPLPDSIPFISNLQYRFPFSIPWDLKRMIQGLSYPAVAPQFQYDLYIRPIDYTWEINIDLSSFNNVALIFRTCFLISFIIGLAIFSYSHFFGS